MNGNFSAQDAQIELIFKEFESSNKSDETLAFYLNYLNENLEFPVQMTGVEDFNWEEYYLLGPGSSEEYEEEKKTLPSYEDIFLMKTKLDFIDSDYGIIADVKRVSDKKKFAIALYELKATDINSKNYQLLHEYSVWCINY